MLGVLILCEIWNYIFTKTFLVKIYVGVVIIYFSFKFSYLWMCP
jgi:hypothetical protein